MDWDVYDQSSDGRINVDWTLFFCVGVAWRMQGDGGNHRALLIGINYKGMGAGELKGCHNDVESMKGFIPEYVSLLCAGAENGPVP